ncbi:MAG: phage Gp37/Gp68 family protein [Nitrospinaceae bacterium]|nr:phage Gp37/Gp68 family protein [Nitrospinaceae bacterium]
MGKTTIGWTDETWNPVTGCDKVSRGCKNCYAGQLAETRLKHTDAYKNGFFGNVIMHYSRLSQPLKWTKPRMIFVDSMGDLFHEQVPFPFIDDVFHVMAKASQHTFQILTKRPDRALDWSMSAPQRQARSREPYKNWPLPNVWMGTSCEDQKSYNLRAGVLVQIPAVVRFLSLEPLVGPIKLKRRFGFNKYGYYFHGNLPEDGIHQVIVGGESGHKAVPMRPDWARSIRDECKEFDIPFFFKQWGQWAPNDYEALEAGRKYRRLDEKNFACMVGKKKAGRMLDGVEHNGYPKLNL